MHRGAMDSSGDTGIHDRWCSDGAAKDEEALSRCDWFIRRHAAVQGRIPRCQWEKNQQRRNRIEGDVVDSCIVQVEQIIHTTINPFFSFPILRTCRVPRPLQGSLSHEQRWPQARRIVKIAGVGGRVTRAGTTPSVPIGKLQEAPREQTRTSCTGGAVKERHQKWWWRARDSGRLAE